MGCSTRSLSVLTCWWGSAKVFDTPSTATANGCCGGALTATTVAGVRAAHRYDRRSPSRGPAPSRRCCAPRPAPGRYPCWRPPFPASKRREVTRDVSSLTDQDVRERIDSVAHWYHQI